MARTAVQAAPMDIRASNRSSVRAAGVTGLGATIRRVRLERGLRLEDLARRAGYTKGFLSKIENGKSAPPIATLLRVAGALGIDPSVLFSAMSGTGGGGGAGTDPHAAVLVTADSRLKITNTAAGPGYDYWSLAAPRMNKSMEPFVLTVRPGEVDPQRRFEHPGEEFIHVLSGRMTYVVGADRFEMGPGDSLYFDASRPHAPLPQGGRRGEPVTFLAVFYTPPKLPKVAQATKPIQSGRKGHRRAGV